VRRSAGTRRAAANHRLYSPRNQAPGLGTLAGQLQALRYSPIQREKGSEEPPFALSYHPRNPQDTVPDGDQQAALWIQQPKEV